MIIPKITSYDTKVIPIMYQDWWRLITIYDDKMFWEKEQKRVVAKNALTPWDDFEDFYKLYPRKVSKKQAQKEWIRLNEKEKTLAIEWLKRYLTYWKINKTEKQHISHPSSWLSAQRWNDELDIPTPHQEKYKEELKKDIEEERKNEEDKLKVNKKIQELKLSWEYNKLEKQALSELSESQRNSPFKDKLVEIRIRMIINNLYF